MSKTHSHELLEQRSRFLATAAVVGTQAEAKRVVRDLKKLHHKAAHHPWACRVTDGDGRIVEQARDDGEVGRPGMKLLELIRREDWQGVLVVSRYYGGVKLGPGGVARACRAAAEAALLGLLGHRRISDG